MTICMSAATDGLAGLGALRLQVGDLHIWRAQESDIPSRLDGLLDLLSPCERSRADAFRFERDQRRFVFCRSALRRLIGSYIGRPPGEIAFDYGLYGKPALSNDSSASHPIQFNLSHTKGRFLFAFSINLPVGIDVETIEAARDWDETARHFFHSNERSFMQMQPELARTDAGYRIWTCKEAVLKVRGDGVGGGLGSFEVVLPVAPPGEAQVRFDESSGDDGICLRPLDEGPGFAAAVATLGRPDQVRIFDWPRA